MKHKIAIVNRSYRSGMRLLLELANNNKYSTFSKSRGELCLLDGTTIKVVTSIHNVRGAKYTQIITDRDNLNILDRGLYDIAFYIMDSSPIPNEFIAIIAE